MPNIGNNMIYAAVNGGVRKLSLCATAKMKKSELVDNNIKTVLR